MQAAFDVPGLAVAIVRPGVEPQFFCSGTTQYGTQSAISPDTLFPVGSCTKSFTSALAAQLMDEKRFRLDAPIRDYLPDFHLADPVADSSVTPRDLLSHRTGVEGHDLLWYRVPWSQADAVARLRLLKSVGEFRQSYHYSSLQYLAVGQALSAAGGKPWATLVRERLTDPLGMTATRFITPNSEVRRAAGHRLDANGSVEAMPEYRLTEPNASGSIVSSARDLAKWAEFQLTGGVYRGRRVVSAQSLAETHTPHIQMPLADPGIGPSYPLTHRVDYCQGWVRFDYRGLTLLAHGGVSDGFRAQITLCPEKQFAVVILSNRHKTLLNLAATNTIVDACAGLEPLDWGTHFLTMERGLRTARAAMLADRDRRRGPPVPPSPLGDYCGEYREAAYGTATITASDTNLRLQWGGIDAILMPYSGDFFRISTGPATDELVEFGPRDTPRVMRLFGRLFQADK